MIQLRKKETNMSSSAYTQTIGIGSQQFAGNVYSPVSALSTVAYPFAMPFHSAGTLFQKRSTPVQLGNSQQNVMAAAEYKRANSVFTPYQQPTKYITPMPSSMRTKQTQSRAVGKYTYTNNTMSTKGYDQSYTASMLQRTRSGGCVPPKKKGAIAAGSVGGWGSIVRSTY